MKKKKYFIDTAENMEEVSTKQKENNTDTTANKDEVSQTNVSQEGQKEPGNDVNPSFFHG